VFITATYTIGLTLSPYFSNSSLDKNVGQVQDLERKWLGEKKRGGSEDTGIGQQDFSTVADFGALVAHVRETKVIPIELSDVIKLLVIALLPFLPVFAVQIPIGEMLSLLLKTLG